MSERQPVAAYDGDFYEALKQTGAQAAGVVVPLLVAWLSPKSVVDVGCAIGTWLAAFRSAGVGDILGLDGPEVDVSHLDVPPSQFRCIDLAVPFSVERTFDLALSLEVGEHLPPDRAASFIADLTALAPVVVFSAAIPHQGGTHHVNEQWPDYWSRLFAVHGFMAVDCLRPLLWADERVAWWYRQNVIVYVSADFLLENAVLSALSRWPGDTPARLVHPHRYLEWVEYATTQSLSRWT